MCCSRIGPAFAIVSLRNMDGMVMRIKCYAHDFAIRSIRLPFSVYFFLFLLVMVFHLCSASVMFMFDQFRNEWDLSPSPSFTPPGKFNWRTTAILTSTICMSVWGCWVAIPQKHIHCTLWSSEWKMLLARWQ